MRSVLLLALCLSGSALAEEGELTVGIAAGALVTDPLEPFDNGLAVTPRVSYALTDGIALEADLGLALGSTRYQGHSYMGLTPRLNLKGIFIPHSTISPYAAVGPGLFIKTADAPEQMPKGFIQGDVDAMLNFGPGVQWAVTDNLQLRADTRILAVFGTERFANHGDTFLNWEFTAGASLLFGVKDQDDDGIKDSEDTCIGEAEDIDGFDDVDGCPDPDNDADQLLDAVDECPLEPEDVDGFEDTDGCPDLDNDQDDIPDEVDMCPLEEGDESAAGCPDADEDGVADAKDTCPQLAGLEDLGGCPDTDEDGLADPDDECPEEAADPSSFGCPDADGDHVPDIRDACVDEAADPRIDARVADGCPADVFLGTEQIFVLTPFAFPAEKADLASESQPQIDAVAEILKGNDLKVEIAVHSDGDATELTQLRAAAIVDALVEAGIDAERLVAKGYGNAEPLDDAESSERIELRLILPDTTEVDGEAGEILEEATEEVQEDIEEQAEEAAEDLEEAAEEAAEDAEEAAEDAEDAAED